MNKILTIVGARPQFIKAAAVSRALLGVYQDEIEEIIVHTGQHYDDNMSKVFFDELDIPIPKYNLSVQADLHGSMTGRMLEQIEKLLIEEKPNGVLIYGDTNSTLAGALAASKIHIPVFHVEAGLRSFNMNMPEEINRILSDRVSSLLFCPTDTAVKNLQRENVEKGVLNIGDVMFDIALFYRDRAEKQCTIIKKMGLTKKKYVLATCHRAENTDSKERLREILIGLSTISKKYTVILPLHPRTKKLIASYNLTEYLDGIKLLEPVSYLDMVALEQGASAVVTDSGGVQKEAFFYNVPCITMRDETEWEETISLGWNKLVGANSKRIIEAFNESQEKLPKPAKINPYGDGNASIKIANELVSFFKKLNKETLRSK
jgi:UDP-GlcNAc3NAcA epimerase